MVLNDVTIENNKEIIGRYDFPNDKYPAGAVIERCSVVFTTGDKMCLCVKEKGKAERMFSFFDGNDVFRCDLKNNNYLTIHSTNFGTMRLFFSDGDLRIIDDRISFNDFDQISCSSTINQELVTFAEGNEKLTKLGIKVIDNGDDSFQIAYNKHLSGKIYGISGDDNIAVFGNQAYFIASVEKDGPKRIIRVNADPTVEDAFEMSSEDNYIKPIKFESIFHDRAVLSIDVLGLRSKIIVDSKMRALSQRCKDIKSAAIDADFDMAFDSDGEEVLLTTKNLLQGEIGPATFTLSRTYSISKDDDIKSMAPNGVEVREDENYPGQKYCSYIRDDGYKVLLFQQHDSTSKFSVLTVGVTSPARNLRFLNRREHVLEPVGLFETLKTETDKMKGVFKSLGVEHKFPDIRQKLSLDKIEGN